MKKEKGAAKLLRCCDATSTLLCHDEREFYETDVFQHMGKNSVFVVKKNFYKKN
jgi:hypothetical protein